MRSLVISVLAAALASCFSPSLPEGLPCSETNRCPGNQSCDLDTGLCSGGTMPNDAPSGPDACAPVPETCNGIDDDCDDQTDEGFTSGAACDGNDRDVCLDDTTICDAQGQEICGDTSGDDDVELCNAFDDDCDGQTDEGFSLGASCDGADTDVCLESTFECAGDGTSVVCNDTGDNDVELCNDADEDCDGVNDNGFDLQSDEQNCGTCGTVCQQINGINTCTTGTCLPMCTTGYADCDGNGNNGCELQNTEPQCSNGAGIDMTVVGDLTGSVETLSGTTERVVRLRVRETIVADTPITARIALTSGPGTNYDLFVFCPSCLATPISDTDDVVEVGRTDFANNDRTFDVMVEVRLNLSMPSTTCAQWTLTVTGGIATDNRCAD